VAAIDSLLALIETQNAQGIALAPGEIPSLFGGGAARALTMPPLDGSVFATLLAEVLGPEDRATLGTTGACEAAYVSAAGKAFVVQAKRVGETVSLRVTEAGGSGHARPPRPLSAPPSERSANTPGARRTTTTIEHLLVAAVDEEASDVILSAGNETTLRVGGELRELPGTRFANEEIAAFFAALLTEAQRRTLDQRGSVDLAYDLGRGPGADVGTTRFRVNVFRQMGGLGAAFRPIRDRIPTLAELHLPPSLVGLTEPRSGLVLMTGTAGSGKSTTLAALLQVMNQTNARHIITLEDPIEYRHPRHRCLIHQREVGQHVDSFASGLRAALRESPDVILVGEMRDRETIALALTAAETGHLVLSTLHSGSGPMAIERIVDVFPEHQQAQIRVQLAGVLRSVVTHRLLPSVEPVGRVPALEIMMVTYAVAAQVREGKTHQLASAIQTGRDDGMVPLERSLVDLVRSGCITRETAARAARDPDEFQRWLREGGR
jgi:twitching motility protein PilT